MRKVDLPTGHEVVNSHELATLRRKARAHDAYLWATKRMADLNRVQGRADEYGCGYGDSLRDFARLVKDAPIE